MLVAATTGLCCPISQMKYGNFATLHDNKSRVIRDFESDMAQGIVG